MPVEHFFELIEKLGERYEITRTDIKKWTVGSPIQGPLDAMEIIRGKRPFEVDQVERVVVRLAPTVAAVVDKSRHSRHLPPAYDRCNAAGQDRVVQGCA